MRRRAPRPLGAALEDALGETSPPGLLAGVQAVWSEVAGSAVAREAEPIAERDGVVTIACESAVWAQELELLAPELVERLNARLGAGLEVAGLRFRSAPGAHP
jgi:predicted nucleic acid-binding Zn ribbon protein